MRRKRIAVLMLCLLVIGTVLVVWADDNFALYRRDVTVVPALIKSVQDR